MPSLPPPAGRLRRRPHSALTARAVAVALAAFVTAPAIAADPAKKPNVVIFLADDKCEHGVLQTSMGNGPAADPRLFVAKLRWWSLRPLSMESGRISRDPAVFTTRSYTAA